MYRKHNNTKYPKKLWMRKKKINNIMKQIDSFLMGWSIQNFKKSELKIK